jgi:single-stranded DNA-binding protein
MVEGRLSNREWTDREGVKRYTTEVIASRVDFGPKKQPALQPESETPAEAPAEDGPSYSDES